MTRPIPARMNLDAIRHNLGVARAAAGGARVLAVAKADAYGHRLARVFPALDHADGLAMLDIADALQARASGCRKPVLLLEGVFDTAELSAAAAADLHLVVHEAGQVAMLERASLPAPVSVWLKMNSGMNRLGFRADAFPGMLARLRVCTNVKQVLLMTHLACADDGRGVGDQLGAFAAACGDDAGARSMANSAALLRHPASRGDWVRPGIMLYGASPFADASAEQLGLEPVMHLQSRIIAEQRVRRGEGVGYGEAFIATHDMRVGVVACGYADGYPRHAPTGTPVVVDGVRTRTVGRVSMDMIAVDLDPCPNAGAGAPVTLWGGDGLSVDEVAQAAGTVGYELLCALAPRVPVEVTGMSVPEPARAG